jgi:hypothetical protein
MLSARTALGGRAVFLGGKEWIPMQISRKFSPVALTLLLAATVLLPARAVEPDKHIPSNTEAVLIINVEQIVGSAAVRKYGLESVKQAIGSHDQLNRFCKVTGLDLLKDIHRIIISASHAGGRELIYAIVVHGQFDLEKIHTVLAEEAKSKPGEVKIETTGDVKVYAIRLKESKDKAYFAAFADGNTLIVSQSAEETLAGVTGSGKVSPALATALSKFGGKESVYGAIVVTDGVKKSFAGNPQMLNLISLVQYTTASFDLNSDFKINLALQTPDAKSADTMKSFIVATKPFLDELAGTQTEKLGPGISGVFKKVEIKTDDKNAVHINLTVPEAVMDQMHENAKGADKIENK